VCISAVHGTLACESQTKKKKGAQAVWIENKKKKTLGIVVQRRRRRRSPLGHKEMVTDAIIAAI